MAQGVIRALTVVAFLAGGGDALALDFKLQRSPEAIVATGEIVKNDLAKFQQFSSRLPRPPNVISLSSPGGLMAEGMALGAWFRSKGFATHIGRGQDCASACVFTFLGGVIREVEPGGRLGVHMASMMMVEDYVRRLKQLLLNKEIPLDTKIQIIIALNEQGAARMAAVEASYLIRMGVSMRMLDPLTRTLQVDIHWLTRQEMLDYNVVNTD
jgi:hypothetical protein